VVENRPAENSDVYNLSVIDTPEFFANGILVHNCVRYTLVRRPDASKPPPHEDHRPASIRIRDEVLNRVKARASNPSGDPSGINNY